MRGSARSVCCKRGKAWRVCGHRRNGAEGAEMRQSVLKYCKAGTAQGSGKVLESNKEQDFRGQQDTGRITVIGAESRRNPQADFCKTQKQIY